jgi:hypothetical protein
MVRSDGGHAGQAGAGDGAGSNNNNNNNNDNDSDVIIYTTVKTDSLQLI